MGLQGAVIIPGKFLCQGETEISRIEILRFGIFRYNALEYFSGFVILFLLVVGPPYRLHCIGSYRFAGEFLVDNGVILTGKGIIPELEIRFS
ncbi:hypothetical protein ES708_09244 [subsurface metagenome]